MLGNDFRNILLMYSAVKSALRINYHNGTECAKTEAARFNDFHFVFESVCRELRLELLHKLCTARRGTARTAADEHMRSV